MKRQPAPHAGSGGHTTLELALVLLLLGLLSSHGFGELRQAWRDTQHTEVVQNLHQIVAAQSAHRSSGEGDEAFTHASFNPPWPPGDTSRTWMVSDRGPLKGWEDLEFRAKAVLSCSYYSYYTEVELPRGRAEYGIGAAACDLDGDGKVSWTYMLNDPGGFWGPEHAHRDVFLAGDDA